LYLTLFNVEAHAESVAKSYQRLESINLQLKWRHQFQFAGYHAAVAQSCYRDKGPKVNILEAGDNQFPADIISSNKAQYGVIDSSILADYANNTLIVVLAAIFQHSPHVLLSRNDSNIRVPSDSIGKRVMLSKKQGAAQFKAMLIHEGENVKKVEILPHSWNLDDLINHKVDAVSIVNPSVKTITHRV